jgi:putative endonuclease
MIEEKPTHEIGMEGEEIALQYLLEHGYKLLQRNWHFGKYEVDLIVENDEYLVFAEVKFRSTSYFGEPEIFVSNKQKLNLVRAANRYISKFDIEKEARFDIVSIVMQNGQPKINHIEDAFKPKLNQF